MKTELCELAEKWTTDKAIFYTSFYHELLKYRRDIKKVLEIGIGYPRLMLSSLARVGVTEYIQGASLFMWREYFPEAQIYALDNRPELFINDTRIRSFYCDQSDEISIRLAMEVIGSDFDLIVEDGSHVLEHQLLSAKMFVPLLSDNGVYIMEDISEPYEAIAEQVRYPCVIKQFSREDLGTAAVAVLRKN